MKEWTREERYRELRDPEELRPLHERIQRSAYRQTWHVQPVTGLSGGPTGFALHQGTWHLFYQWCPWGAVHGLTYWYHVTSPDLVRWTNQGLALGAGRDFDNRGIRAGSAVSAGDDLVLFYTGDHRDADWVRTPYTCAAVLGPDGTIVRRDEPLFGPRPTCTELQRGPKVVFLPEKGLYYLFLGAQTQSLSGTVLVYASREPLRGWRFAGQLKVSGYERFGGMWECPSIVRLGGKDLLIFSPRDTKLPGRGENTNHSVYLTGTMDYDTLTFRPEGKYHFLDCGFDFYAAQSAAGSAAPDRAVLIGWIGLPGSRYPTAEEDADWEGSLSAVRELRFEGGRLLQTPVRALESLRGPARKASGPLPRACELEIALSDGDFELALFTREDGSGGFRLRYDAKQRRCAFDRSAMDLRFNEALGETLNMPLDRPLERLRVLIDSSSVEFFANDGEACFTSHCYPTARENGLFITLCEGARLWPLGPSVRDDFVL